MIPLDPGAKYDSLDYFHETHNRVATFYKNPYNELHENSTDGLVPGTRLQMDGRVQRMKHFIILIVKGGD